MMKLITVINISSLTLLALYSALLLESGNDTLFHDPLKVWPGDEQEQLMLELEQKMQLEEAADAIYHGIPIFYRDYPPPRSRVHCIGNNFFGPLWLFKSCKYRRYCLDVSKGEWLVFLQDPVLPADEDWDGYSDSSTNPRRLYTSGGPQAKAWYNSRDRYDISPIEIGGLQPNLAETLPSSFYEFPSETTVVHYYRHPKSHMNPGHLVWDDFLSVYTLLDIFDRIEGSSSSHPIILALQPRALVPANDRYGSGPYTSDTDLLFKFLPLWGDRVRLMDMSSLINNNRTTSTTSTLRSNYICAPIGLNGNGLFSDHGHDHWHGQVIDDYELPHNLGRGASFRRFRQFLWNNISPGADRRITKPYQIVVSVNSSTKATRSGIHFRDQIRALERSFPETRVRSCCGAELSLEEQLGLVQNAAIYITTVGGGSVTGFFMPSNANVILYTTNTFLDWDLWNNVGDLRVHWMPHMGSTNETQGRQYSTGYLLRLVGRLLAELEEELD